MPFAEDVRAVKRLCDMVQYPAKFLPNSVGDLEPIQYLTQKNMPWQWTNELKQVRSMTLGKT